MVKLSESKGARVFGRVAVVTGLIVVAIHYNQHQERQVGAASAVFSCHAQHRRLPSLGFASPGQVMTEVNELPLI
jgi:hypothetical protein